MKACLGKTCHVSLFLNHLVSLAASVVTSNFCGTRRQDRSHMGTCFTQMKRSVLRLVWRVGWETPGLRKDVRHKNVSHKMGEHKCSPFASVWASDLSKVLIQPFLIAVQLKSKSHLLPKLQRAAPLGPWLWQDSFWNGPVSCSLCSQLVTFLKEQADEVFQSPAVNL